MVEVLSGELGEVPSGDLLLLPAPVLLRLGTLLCRLFFSILLVLFFVFGLVVMVPPFPLPWSMVPFPLSLRLFPESRLFFLGGVVEHCQLISDELDGVVQVSLGVGWEEVQRLELPSDRNIVGKGLVLVPLLFFLWRLCLFGHIFIELILLGNDELCTTLHLLLPLLAQFDIARRHNPLLLSRESCWL